MLHVAGKRIPYALGIIPFSEIYNKRDHTSRAFYLEANEDETGWDRLRNMYSIDEFGNQSPEMNFVMQGTFTGILAGVIWGGILKSRLEYINFIQRNDATKFTSIYEAQKKLQDTVTLNFARGGFQWGWRLGLFTGSYVLITTSISAYRGKSSLIEYAAAGVLTGSCYKINLGPKGILVGGLVGGFLGGFAGAISLAILRLTGTTMEEIRYWQYGWKINRDKQIHSTLRTRMQETSIELAHDAKLSDIKELIPDPKSSDSEA